MIKQYLGNKLSTSDLVLAKVEDFDQQKGKARLIEVYRTKYLFTDKHVALKCEEFSFIGGGAWGETPNYPGEPGFLFLSQSRRHLGKIRRDATLLAGTDRRDRWLSISADKIG